MQEHAYEEWRSDKEGSRRQMQTLAIVAGRVGIPEDEIARAYAPAYAQLLSLVRERVQDASVAQSIRDAKENLPGLYAAEEVARGSDIYEHPDEDDWEFSNQTLAVIRKRQEAEELVEAAEIVEEYGEGAA